MLKLVRFDLRNSDEWEQFYNLFSAYLSEVCDEEEYRENIDDLHNEKLNRQMIEQTLQKKNPYFVMQIELDEKCIGIISFSYNEEKHYGFINNFYICMEYRNTGVGSSVYLMVETQLKELGASQIELIPVGKAWRFYVHNGFLPSRITADGERVYCKEIVQECGSI